MAGEFSDGDLDFAVAERVCELLPLGFERHAGNFRAGADRGGDVNEGIEFFDHLDGGGGSSPERRCSATQRLVCLHEVTDLTLFAWLPP